jgi:hypothetical protein
MSDSQIYAYLMSHSQMVGGALVLDLGKDTIALQGLSATSLSLGSFIFA